MRRRGLFAGLLPLCESKSRCCWFIAARRCRLASIWASLLASVLLSHEAKASFASALSFLADSDSTDGSSIGLVTIRFPLKFRKLFSPPDPAAATDGVDKFSQSRLPPTEVSPPFKADIRAIDATTSA